MPKVSVIILNWNGKQFLKDCLNAVFNQTYNDFEVVFVDNASSDGSADFVKQEFLCEIKSGKLKIVINDRNYGFAEGNNIGVRNSSPDSEYIALLNNDTVVDPNWLEELVRILDEDKTVGAVCSLDTGPVGRLEAIDNPVGVLGHTAVYSYAGLERLTEPFETLFPGGAATLYRRALQSSPFDP
ncbi:MAG: glycosyltransferase family 2 protein, partial [Candidatus Aenigmatarchaeota archaeon]